MNQTKFVRVLLLTAFFGVSAAGNSAENPRSDQQQTRRYQSKEFGFWYPSDFKLSVEDNGTVIRLRFPNQSPYWEDTITIRKLNKKTEECDIPQDSHPDTGDRRSIAGHRTSSYSGENAAMNRYLRRKGYFIEDDRSCWNFELIREGRPYQKLDLSSEEVKRLDRQSNQDSEKAKAAFEMVLDSFAFRRK